MKHFQICSLVLFPAIFLMLFFSCSDKESTEPEDISLKQAESIIFNKILNSNDSGKVVYELQTKLKANYIIKHSSQHDSVSYSYHSESWFFFIDDFPLIDYSHPCRYVFVSVENGTFSVYNENFFPTIIESLTVVKFK